jgi:hypothetical protein
MFKRGVFRWPYAAAANKNTLEMKDSLSRHDVRDGQNPHFMAKPGHFSPAVGLH